MLCLLSQIYLLLPEFHQCVEQLMVLRVHPDELNHVFWIDSLQLIYTRHLSHQCSLSCNSQQLVWIWFRHLTYLIHLISYMVDVHLIHLK